MNENNYSQIFNDNANGIERDMLSESKETELLKYQEMRIKRRRLLFSIIIIVGIVLGIIIFGNNIRELLNDTFRELFCTLGPIE